MTPAKPILWLRADTTPHAIIGDSAWVDVNVTCDVWVPAAGETAALAAHCHGLNVDDTNCLWLRVTAGAAGTGVGGAWAVYAGAGAMANSSIAPKTGGALTLAPGTWTTLSIRVAGASATLWAGGAQLASVVLSSVGAPASGFAGLGVAAYGHFSAFDALAIAAAVPPPPPACAAALLHPLAPAPPCPPGSAGTRLVTAPCGASSAWAWTAAPASGGALGTLSPLGAPTLCAGTNASRPNAQTGAPSVELQRCAGSEGQLWSPPPAVGGAAGPVASGLGPCMEVTKNELGAGVFIEVWGCNRGLNQGWCALPGGALATMLDAASGECLSACAA